MGLSADFNLHSCLAYLRCQGIFTNKQMDCKERENWEKGLQNLCVCNCGFVYGPTTCMYVYLNGYMFCVFLCACVVCVVCSSKYVYTCVSVFSYKYKKERRKVDCVIFVYTQIYIFLYVCMREYIHIIRVCMCV